MAAVLRYMAAVRPDPVQDRNRFTAQMHVTRTGLAVRQVDDIAVAVYPAPFKGGDLAVAASGQQQQPDDIGGLPVQAVLRFHLGQHL